MWYCHMCLLQLPLMDTATSNPCGVSLLLRPDTKTLRQCDIRLKSGHEPFWTRLHSTGAWLYFLNEPEKIQIIRKNNKDKLISLAGSGILYLKERCMGKTHYITLPGVEMFKQGKQYLYQPELSLNLSLISTSLNDQHLVQYLKDEMQDKTQGKPDFQLGKSLYEVESQLEEIGGRHRERRQQQQLVYGSYLIGIAM